MEDLVKMKQSGKYNFPLDVEETIEEFELINNIKSDSKLEIFNYKSRKF